MNDTRYSRLYWRLSSEYPTVWGDAKLLGAYVHCLVAAEMAYPHPAARPASCSPASFRKLAEAGLVLERPGGYTVLGLEKERATRTAAGKRAARGRWGK